MFWSKATSNSTMLALHLACPRLEFVETRHHDHRRRQAGGRGRARAAQRGEHHALADAGRPAAVLDQLGRFLAAHPVRHLDRLQRHLRAQLAHRLGHLGHGRRRAGRTRQARTDQVGHVRHPFPGIVALQCGIADLGQRGRIVAGTGRLRGAGEQGCGQQAEGEAGGRRFMRAILRMVRISRLAHPATFCCLYKGKLPLRRAPGAPA